MISIHDDIVLLNERESKFMKRAAFVVSTLNIGGAQRIISNIIMALPDEWDIDIILNEAEDIVYPYRGRIISLGFKPQEDKMNLLYQGKVFIKRIFALRKLKKSQNYVACVSALESANIANILSGNKYCKTITTVHCNITAVKKSWIYQYLIRLLVRIFYPLANYVITVSKGVEYDLIHKWNLPASNIVTIYNGYDSEKIRNDAKEELSREEKEWFYQSTSICTVGRLAEPKGQWHLIRALRKVKEKIPNIKLLILGDGPLENYLRSLVDECNLQENVVFCGFMNNPFKIVAHCKLNLAPSIYEGFSNVLVEAMNCGVVSIATDFSSGAREILAPNTSLNEKNVDKVEYAEYGVITPICDGTYYTGDIPLTKEEEILADAIINILKDNKAMIDYKSKIVKRAIDFDMDMCINNWTDLFMNT